MDCQARDTCHELIPAKASPSPATYTGSQGFPPRKNIHERHLVNQNGGFEFLHPRLSQNYISRVPAPKGAVDDSGILIPWQTSSRWAYPQEEDRSPPHDPNDSFGVPDVADEECLSRTDIPWKQRKGTKVYLKVCPYRSY